MWHMLSSHVYLSSLGCCIFVLYPVNVTASCWLSPKWGVIDVLCFDVMSPSHLAVDYHYCVLFSVPVPMKYFRTDHLWCNLWSGIQVPIWGSNGGMKTPNCDASFFMEFRILNEPIPFIVSNYRKFTNYFAKFHKPLLNCEISVSRFSTNFPICNRKGGSFVA